MPFRVLVVDDATFVRETIKRNLRPIIPDVEFFEAGDGKRAASLVKVNAVDLILSDWEMPGMSGEEFLKWVRSQPQSEATPFLMVSSRGDRDHVLGAVNAGVSDYLTKPFTPEELQRKVLKQLRRLGYQPPQKGAAGGGGVASGSLQALTGGKPTVIPTQKRDSGAASALLNPGAAKAPAANPASSRSSSFQGNAQIRFAKQSFSCEIKEVSLQALSGIIERGDRCPTVFDQAVVDLEDREGKAIARLNGYVQAVLAAGPGPDAEQIRITVRFVDKDPAKFEVLSQAIAGI